MPIPGPQGPQGPAGANGAQGPTGPAGLSPALQLIATETFSANDVWSTQNNGGRLYRVVVVGSGASGAGGRVSAAGNNISGGSGGGGGAWQDDWYPRSSIELPVRWWWHGGLDAIGMGNVLSKERTDAFSVFAWYKTVSNSQMCLIGKQADSVSAGWRLLIGTLTQDFVMFGASGPTRLAVNALPPPPADGREHFYGITKTTSPLASGLTFYIDGVAVGKVITEDTLAHTTLSSTPLQLGLRGATLPLIGGMRHVSMWNRDLTALEVAEIYAAGAPPTLTSVSCAAALNLWMKLDGTDALGAGGVNDYSTSNFDGTAAATVNKGMHMVLVGAEVAGGLGTTASGVAANAGIAGTAGNPSMFGFLLSAYGGGGGNTNPGSTQHTAGGSGGGTLSTGPSAPNTGVIISGGEPAAGDGLAGFGGGGSAAPTPGFFASTGPLAARPAIQGGGHGGFSLASGAGRPGGKSRKGGGGGGPGGGSNLGQNGNPGGRSGAPAPTDIWGAFGGDGGVEGLGTITSGLVVGADGGPGNPGNEDHAGDGGGGGGAGLGVNARGGKGGDGGVPGGGGGGGGTAVFTSGAAVISGNGGKGARGEVRVYTYG